MKRYIQPQTDSILLTAMLMNLTISGNDDGSGFSGFAPDGVIDTGEGPK